MSANLDEGRCWRRMAACLALAVMTATFPAGETQSAEPVPITWEQLSQMGGGIDFPHVMRGQDIRATLKGALRYTISDGTPQTLFFFLSTNCKRGVERPKEATINCNGVPGRDVYIPVLFVKPATRPRRADSTPPELVLRFGSTNSLEHYVAEDPANPRRSGRTKSVWVKIGAPFGNVKTTDEPAVQAALVLCVPVSSSECQNDNIRLTNFADESEQAAALSSGPTQTSDGRSRPTVGPAGPTAPENPPPSSQQNLPPSNLPAPSQQSPNQQSPNQQGAANPEVAPPRSPGPWLLGLYGPQNIGVGVDANAGVIADAKDQILTSMIRFLDDFHTQSFRSPIADLVLMTTPDAAAAAFPLKNVLNGTSRQPPADKPGKLQLDHEGDRRLAAFLSGPTSSGAEASFNSVGDMIKHYAQQARRLRGDSGQRPPVVIYVGAVRPLPNTCAEWKKMTADLAVNLPGRPRVLGVVFANISVGQIDQQLGRNERGAPEPIAARTRAPTCNGDGGSTLLFVPFPDLTSHTPEDVLAQAFGAVRRRADQLQN
jgi:hypothetical protein